MFTADAIIDAVQTSKKTFINTFVTNETTKDTLVKFVDAQAEYTRKAAKVGLDTVTALTSEAVKQAEGFAKFDWVKATQSVLDTFKTKTK